MTRLDDGSQYLYMSPMADVMRIAKEEENKCLIEKVIELQRKVLQFLI